MYIYIKNIYIYIYTHIIIQIIINMILNYMINDNKLIIKQIYLIIFFIYQSNNKE